MFLFILRINQYVVYKDQDKLIQIPTEYDVHHTHEVRESIGQPKQHQYKLVVPVPCTKGSFVNILIMNLYLMVPRSQVNI